MYMFSNQWYVSKNCFIFHENPLNPMTFSMFLSFFPNETSSFSHHDSTSGWWFGTCGLFFHILGMSSSQLTFHIFQRGGSTTNQICVINIPLNWILSNFVYIFSKKCSSFPIRFPPTFSERCPLLAKSLADVQRAQPRVHITRRRNGPWAWDMGPPNARYVTSWFSSPSYSINRLIGLISHYIFIIFLLIIP